MQIVSPDARILVDIGGIAIYASRDERTIWAERHSDGNIQAASYLRVPETWVHGVGMN
jgi:hypothetical protein